MLATWPEQNDPITVANESWQISKLIKKYADQTGGQISPFHLNDFGFRGVSSRESAGIGGMAHLVSFSGSDTIEGILYAQQYYDAQPGVGMSVFASEHSTTTIYGRDHEYDAFERFIRSVPDDAVVSIVADSYDIVRAVNYGFAQKLAGLIMSRKGRVVVRPDSGHPPQMTTQVLRGLLQGFVPEKNSEGYLLLPPQIGVIYGDFMSYDMVAEVCEAMIADGWAVDGRNVVFGMGGKLLQDHSRDTQRFAFKCSAAQVDGKWVDVYKDPVSDTSKKSKRGRLKLIRLAGARGYTYMTVPENHPADDLLETVFRDGHLTRHQAFSDIRKRANSGSTL